MDNAQAPPEPPTITAHVTVTGEAAELLRDLAAVAGRSPEELALEYATGKLVLPTTDQPVEWALFAHRLHRPAIASFDGHYLSIAPRSERDRPLWVAPGPSDS